MPEPLVVAMNVSRAFGSAGSMIKAVHDANCTILPGQQIAITGPSGSGKSTLLHLLGGLDTPTSGLITWPALGARDGLRPTLITDIFQGPSLLTPLSVIENVRLPMLLGGIDPTEATGRATSALARFGVGHLAEKLPEEISGGQAQRVAIARGIALHPALILADEPTGQLDSHTAILVLDELLAAVKSTGAALVVSTHDLRIADRLEINWSMTNGCLLTAQTPALVS